MFGAVHLVSSSEKIAFLFRRDATVPFHLGFGFDLHADTMERRRAEDRRRPAAAPIDRVSQNRQRPVHRSNGFALGIDAFEIFDGIDLFQREHRQRSERRFERTDPTPNRCDTAQRFRDHIAVEIEVEKVRRACLVALMAPADCADLFRPQSRR